MAIIPLKKFTLIGEAEEKEAWLAPLQSLGLMHITEHKEATHTQDANIGLPEKAQEALRYLLDTKTRIKSWDLKDPNDIHYLIEQVIANKQKRRELEDLRDDYLQFIRVRNEWGDFQFPSVEEFGGYRLWFYIVAKSQFAKLQNCPHPWQVIEEKNGRFYTVVICPHEPTKIDMPFHRVRTGYKSLHQLQEELSQVERDLDDNQLTRTSLTRWINAIGKHLDAVIDHAECSRANCQFSIVGELCILQGWVPAESVKVLAEFAEENNLAWLDEVVETDDEPPTLLRTHPILNGAKSIVQFFQTPGYRTWDPSLMVFISFNVFFAMILSDAGYAAVCAVLILFNRKKLKNKGVGVYRLVQMMIVSSLVWGVLVGSYFGFTPTPGGFLDAVSIIDLNDFDFMIQLSVAIGVLHLIVANLSAANARVSVSDSGKRLIALSDVGWALVFASGFTWFIWDVGRLGLAIGLVMVFIFASSRPVIDAKSGLFRVLDGLKALTGFSKGFGDVLSYMRLFALGLSSAQLAITFNGIAQSVIQDVPGVGLFLGILIMVAGHMLNLVLGIMGGVIHGLRLNLIEFLNWGIKAEGYAFKPFAKREDLRWK